MNPFSTADRRGRAASARGHVAPKAPPMFTFAFPPPGAVLLLCDEHSAPAAGEMAQPDRASENGGGGTDDFAAQRLPPASSGHPPPSEPQRYTPLTGGAYVTVPFVSDIH